MEFKKYGSIENSYRSKTVNHIKELYSKEEFTVTEKVHGANGSLFFNGTEFKAGKRTSFIDDHESFYGIGDLVSKLEDHVRKLYQSISKIEELVIYGEYCGGNYPHPNISSVKRKAVQKGVLYHPDVTFVAFDIMIDGKLVDVDTFTDLIKYAGIPYLPVLHRGTLDSCLAYSNEFPTTVPAIFGLPPLEDNNCEGVVIKTTKPLFMGNGSRVILKNKNEAFTEKKKGPKKVKTPEKDLNPEVIEIRSEIDDYITENRLRNVISKIGSIQHKDFGMLLGKFSSDCIDEYKIHSPKFHRLETSERKQVTSYLNKECGNVIRNNLSNIIDGEF